MGGELREGRDTAHNAGRETRLQLGETRLQLGEARLQLWETAYNWERWSEATLC